MAITELSQVNRAVSGLEWPRVLERPPRAGVRFGLVMLAETVAADLRSTNNAKLMSPANWRTTHHARSSHSRDRCMPSR